MLEGNSCARARERRHPDLSGQITVGLVGAVVAGVETAYQNVHRAVAERDSMTAVPLPVRPYVAGDAIERIVFWLPSSVRGTLRSVSATAPLFGTRRLDVVWTQIDLALLPWMLTANAIRQVPVIYSADSTPRLLRSFGALYGNWGGSFPLKTRARDALQRMFLRRATMLVPWTAWAARSMRDDHGVDPRRIRVIPPGVDTAFWVPAAKPPRPRARILFVGGDFHRKGGDLLVDVFRNRFQNTAELDLVTRGPVLAAGPARVHSGIGPNDPRLLSLYQAADLLVIPTRADCFSIAGTEALAAGLPVVTCPVGGVAELMEHGRQGLFVPPDDGVALAAAIEALLHDPVRRAAMGASARTLAERRYNSQTNVARMLDMLEELHPAA